MKTKTLRHNLERAWRRSRTNLDRSRYKHQCHMCNRMMTKAKSKFLAEVITIRSKFPDEVQNIPPVKKKTEIRSKMNIFESASEKEIQKLILSSSSKSCDQEPIPTTVLKNYLDISITPITDIIKISIETSTFPQNFKEVHVRPVLKKHIFLKTN